MISYMHTPDDEPISLVHDHPISQGMLLRILNDGVDGLYNVVRVMHTTPSGRVDVYATRISDVPDSTTWSAIMDAINRPIHKSGYRNKRSS
jgi:hypothetical protein